MKIEMAPEQITHSVAVETRNWLARGVVPPMAAAVRRENARMFPLMAPLHNAIADEWDRIAATQPGKMVKAWEGRRDSALKNLMHHNPGTEYYRIWETQAVEADKAILAINPNYKPER